MGAASEHGRFLAAFERLALAAGPVVMEIFDGPMSVGHKADLSPVTEADRHAEAIILEGLRAAFPDIPCVAEEEAAEGVGPRDPGPEFFLIDPLDGTREFVSRNPDFTVNIALIRNGIPVAGVVFAPARGTLYAGAGDTAFRLDLASGERSGIAARTLPSRPVILASRSHRTAETDAWVAARPECDTLIVGSSLKFCMIAEGAADIYPRHGRTMEWDTAAGDAVLRAAGGNTRTLDGAPMTYGKRGRADEADYANPSFLATGRAAVNG